MRGFFHANDKKAALKKPFHKTFCMKYLLVAQKIFKAFLGIQQIATCTWQFVIRAIKPRLNMLMKLTPACMPCTDVAMKQYCQAER
jgi:hypothetical protein